MCVIMLLGNPAWLHLKHNVYRFLLTRSIEKPVYSSLLFFARLILGILFHRDFAFCAGWPLTLTITTPFTSHQTGAKFATFAILSSSLLCWRPGPARKGCCRTWALTSCYCFCLGAQHFPSGKVKSTLGAVGASIVKWMCLVIQLLWDPVLLSLKQDKFFKSINWKNLWFYFKQIILIQSRPAACSKKKPIISSWPNQITF